MPLFRKGLGPYALPLAMSGVKLGERMLYVGSGTPALFAAMAAKPGLTGRACALVASPAEAEAMRRAAEREGVLVEIATAAAGAYPYAADSFDVAVIDSSDGAFGAMTAADRQRTLREIALAVRPGARVLVIESVRGGIGALLGGTRVDAGYRAPDGAKAALEEAGFRPVRVLAEREHLRFTEGLKPGAAPAA